jgi:hypothetical protein
MKFVSATAKLFLSLLLEGEKEDRIPDSEWETAV